MLISSVALGLMLAVVRRGDLRQLATVRFRWWWLIVLAVALKFAFVRDPGSARWALAIIPGLHNLVYALLLIPLLANIRLPGMRLIAAGIALNGVAVVANGGRMPVPESTLAALGKTGTIAALASGQSMTHGLTTAQTWFPYLGDWIALPPPWSAAVSLGDFILAAGVIVLIATVAQRQEFSSGHAEPQLPPETVQG